jgi:hypothetical protein
MIRSRHNWTNPSVLNLAQGQEDPIAVIIEKTRAIILDAVEKGWSGPPFDPFRLAELLKVPVIPRDDVLDARLVPSGSGGRIEFNPNRPPGRTRFSLAHEIAHTLFPDYGAAIRQRGPSRGDDWQVELLCNIAAAEVLIPIGTAVELESESVDIDNLMSLRKRIDVSTEAIFLRMVRLTDESCAMFAAARLGNGQETPNFRIDYTAPSRSWRLEIPQGLQVSGSLALSECTAVGYTTKGFEKWTQGLPEFAVECVGIAPYPGDRYPRVVGVLRRRHGTTPDAPRLTFVYGDATEPRGTGRRLIAHIVNDKTPNWGAGFARQVRTKWKFVQGDFRRWVSEHEHNLALGNTHVTEVSKDLSIVHMVAQHGYGSSPKPRIRYAALRKCLDQLATLTLKQQATVHMPRIGAGQAGGHWGIIRELIDNSLVWKEIEVTVYDLPGAEPPKEVQGLLPLGATDR